MGARPWPARVVLVLVAALAFSLPAGATYSIVVADTSTGQVGVAVASCVGSYDLAPLFRVVPGVGAVQVQAHTGFYAQGKIYDLLSRGVAPSRALELVTDANFDPREALRQYAVVDFWGRVAAFTGDADGVWAGDRQGAFQHLHYSAQGNLLTGPEVLSSLETGMRSLDACDLAERLLLSLETVARATGQGDARCTPRGVSANSGYLRVASSQGVPLVELDVQATGNAEPVLSLRADYDVFRAQHPCGSLQSSPVPCPAPAPAPAMSVAPRARPGRAGPFVLAAAAALLAWRVRRRALSSR